MKCTNCGFNAENDPKCPVCGYQLAPEKPPTQPAQAPIPPQAAYPNQPVSAARQPTAPKKKSKAGLIVLLCIIGTVIIAGIFLAIFSRMIFNSAPITEEKSTTEVIIEDDAESSDYEVSDSDISDIEVVYPIDKLDISKYKVQKIGEYANLENAGSVRVADIKKTSNDSSSPEEYTNYEMTLEFKNTTDQKLNFADFELAFFDKDGKNLDPGGEAAKNAKPLVVINDPYNKYRIYSDKNPGESYTRAVKFSALNKVGKAYFALKKHGFRSSDSNQTAVIEIDLNSIK